MRRAGTSSSSSFSVQQAEEEMRFYSRVNDRTKTMYIKIVELKGYKCESLPELTRMEVS